MMVESLSADGDLSRDREKSMQAFRTISEVANDLDVPQHVLRFWESKFSHVRPMKRGGNRRYYRPEDVHMLQAIRHYLYNEGYTIKGVQKLLKENGANAFVDAFDAGLIPGVVAPSSVKASLNGHMPTQMGSKSAPAMPVQAANDGHQSELLMKAVIEELRALRKLVDEF